jgi:predicted DNA binding CopG/RHH family protein
MNKKNKQQSKDSPEFANEKEEREFWENNDSSQLVDWDDALVDPSFPKLKPSTRTISLRMPISMLNRLKELSNRKDIPYQSYIKSILDEKLKEEDH